ncbi:MAG: Fur family transcriptional regulator [Tissierellia bacterium]|nr:Fur family transcriptional regulator [Tissierellia bacterium]
MADEKTIKNLLQAKGYKFTRQRQEIYDIFLENRDCHMTTEEVFLQTKKKGLDIGIATVYRTVQLLEEMGLITAITFKDGLVRYEIRDEEETHTHHHVVCNECNKVLEVDLDLLNPLEELIEKNTGFHILDHNLKFYGYCNDCYQKVKGADHETKLQASGHSPRRDG